MENKTILALGVVTFVFITIIWNVLVLPGVIEQARTSKEDTQSCINFCTKVDGTIQYELEYHHDKNLAYCYCKDIEGKILARPTYYLV